MMINYTENIFNIEVNEAFIIHIIVHTDVCKIGVGENFGFKLLTYM